EGECEKVLEGHNYDISCVVVWKKKLISGSWDQTLRIWDKVRLLSNFFSL
ncbi:MAG: hypothetical protein ACXWE0_07430, partial [Nitrososphaeraceae archaeon]